MRRGIGRHDAARHETDRTRHLLRVPRLGLLLEHDLKRGPVAVKVRHHLLRDPLEDPGRERAGVIDEYLEHNFGLRCWRGPLPRVPERGARSAGKRHSTKIFKPL